MPKPQAAPHNTPMQAFGQQLRTYRQTWGMSQRTLAERANTTQSTIAHIEAGTANPTIDLLNRLAIATTGYEIHIILNRTRRVRDERN